MSAVAEPAQCDEAVADNVSTSLRAANISFEEMIEVAI